MNKNQTNLFLILFITSEILFITFTR